MAEIPLMALYWTLSGPVEIHQGREWSLFSWPDRCAEAAKVGFEGLGLWHADVSHQLESTTLAEMKRVFDDAGLKYLEVEFLWEFFVPPGQPARADSDALRRQLFETAAAFDAHHIKVGNIPETPCELDRLIEEYAALCDDAAQHTDARIAYEIIPFDPNVHTLDAGLRLVTEAGRPNGGLAIDTWHMGKLQIAPEELRRIPGEYLAWVELSDGPGAVHGRSDRRGHQPPAAPGRGRVRHSRLHRGMPGGWLRRAVGRRGAVRGAAVAPARGGGQARIRDHGRAVPRRRDLGPRT